MNNNIIVSPCINVCKSDPLTDFCYGCGRSNEDKLKWKNPEISNEWKEKNLLVLNERLTGWQKIAFNESYQNKKETGISLIKKKLTESNK